MRIALVTALAVGLAAICPPQARADVVGCGGSDSFGTLTCTTSGPASIDGYSFVGDGASSAQFQWRGATNAAAPGTLSLGYIYAGVYNTLFAKIGLRLTVSQPTCDEPHDSKRNWIDVSSSNGVPESIGVRVHCAGPVQYTITSRAATFSPGGSFIGALTLTSLTVTSAASGAGAQVG